MSPALTEQMLPTLRRAVGAEHVRVAELWMPAEDFAHYQQVVPSLYLLLGIVPAGKDTATAARNHSPLFAPDESALPIGVQLLANLALDWLKAHPLQTAP